MSRNSRIALVAAAAVVAVAAIVIIGTGGSNGGGKDSTNATTNGAPGTTSGAATTTAQAKVPVVTVKDGKAVGGEQTISAKSGERARFEVTSDADHEIHLHGFDVAKEVKAGRSVAFDVKADAPGIYEFEIEDTGTKIGQVKVEP